MTYLVHVKRFLRTKRVHAKARYRCTNTVKFTRDSANNVAAHAVSTMQAAGKGMRFSGMEEFGEAHEFWNDGHECPEDGSSSDECERLEVEACREWIEKRTEELVKGESETLHLTTPDGFTEFIITCK